MDSFLLCSWQHSVMLGGGGEEEKESQQVSYSRSIAKSDALQLQLVCLQDLRLV